MSSFRVTYQIYLVEDESIDQKVEDICLEQSVELPRAVLSEEIADRIPGQPVEQNQISDRKYQVEIEWSAALIGDDISQFLNILFGNISLKNGIQIMDLQWQSLPDGLFEGPAHGVSGLRRRYNIAERPLSSSAIKPLGSSSNHLAELVYEMASGGIDIIKDDHGLANQLYAPFKERVKQCVAAIQRAADDTGHRARYYPNITTDAVRLQDRYQLAHELGADGVLISPHLTGLSFLDKLSKSLVDLPIIAHPAFSGTLVTDDKHGMSPGFLYGQLYRSLGADLSIFPNTGGRFSFTLDQCRQICQSAVEDSSPFKKTFPMIGGGIDLDELPGWISTYPVDTVYLIGSSLYQHPKGLRYASREFSEHIRGKTS